MDIQAAIEMGWYTIFPTFGFLAVLMIMVWLIIFTEL